MLLTPPQERRAPALVWGTHIFGKTLNKNRFRKGGQSGSTLPLPPPRGWGSSLPGSPRSSTGRYVVNVSIVSVTVSPHTRHSRRTLSPVRTKKATLVAVLPLILACNYNWGAQTPPA